MAGLRSLRHMAEAAALHVLAGDLDAEFEAQRFPGEILSWLQRLLPPGMRCSAALPCRSRFSLFFQGDRAEHSCDRV